ncbi:MAG: hypothetical protein OQL06_09100 [Gammaproteobacteria bacterium]|nr:hypothetical protein [Gammaproteobacteria bacterium]
MKKFFKQFETRISIQLQKCWIFRANGLPIILAAMADYAGVIQFANIQLVLLASLCVIGIVNPESKENTSTDHKADLRMNRLRRSHQHTLRHYSRKP